MLHINIINIPARIIHHSTNLTSILPRASYLLIIQPLKKDYLKSLLVPLP